MMKPEPHPTAPPLDPVDDVHANVNVNQARPAPTQPERRLLDDAPQDEDEDTYLRCHICNQSEPVDELIAACNCRGTGRVAHKSCLTKIRSEAANLHLFTHCHACGAEYMALQPPRQEFASIERQRQWRFRLLLMKYFTYFMAGIHVPLLLLARMFQVADHSGSVTRALPSFLAHHPFFVYYACAMGSLAIISGIVGCMWYAGTRPPAPSSTSNVSFPKEGVDCCYCCNLCVAGSSYTAGVSSLQTCHCGTTDLDGCGHCDFSDLCQGGASNSNDLLGFIGLIVLGLLALIFFYGVLVVVFGSLLLMQNRLKAFMRKKEKVTICEAYPLVDLDGMDATSEAGTHPGWEATPVSEFCRPDVAFECIHVMNSSSGIRGTSPRREEPASPDGSDDVEMRPMGTSKV